MANKDFTDLPSVTSALLADVYAAVQGSVTSKISASQLFTLMLNQTILNYAGDPNGHVAGQIFQFCWNTTNQRLFICTSSGSSTTAIWMQAAIGFNDAISASQGGTGVSSPTANTIPVAKGSSPFDFIGPLTDGQITIGSTGNTPVAATILPGLNVNVTNGPGSITISATGTGASIWNVISSTSATMLPNQGYITDNAALVTLALPALAGVGDEIQIIGKGAGGWKVSQGASQQIILGSNASSVGAGGSVSSTNQFDTLTLICTIANTTWTRTTFGANLTYV